MYSSEQHQEVNPLSQYGIVSSQEPRNVGFITILLVVAD